MRWFKIGGLLTLLCLPICVIFTFDDVYNGLQDDICRHNPAFSNACLPYDRRYDTIGIVSTAFYQHLSGLLGRGNANEVTFIDAVQQTAVMQPKQQAASERIVQKLHQFNRNFLISMVVSTAVAGASMVILVQRIYLWVTRIRVQRATKSTKTDRDIRRTPVARPAKRPLSKQAASRQLKKPTTRRKVLPKRTKTTAKPRRPETIRPRSIQ